MDTPQYEYALERKDLKTGELKLLFGGHWYDDREELHYHARMANQRFTNHNIANFRVVRRTKAGEVHYDEQL